MARRTYGQICGVARALDVLGERWTFLIVRDLLISPKRFKDLLDGLPGIGTNLLADRLQRLEELGLVERVKEAGELRSVTLYRPTSAGQAAEPIVRELMRWAWRHLPDAPDSTRRRPRE